MTTNKQYDDNALWLSDLFNDDCPFSYQPNEDPLEIQHKIIGICCSCGDDAYTQSPLNELDIMCWGCAYDSAN